MAKIKVQNTEITIVTDNEQDYISLTDMARSQMQEHIIFRWLSLKSTIEYIGEWEMLYNPHFNCTEFGTIKNMAGSNNFVLSVKTWIERTGAVGIISKAGRYGGTYAHRDIAYHFGMWISPRFQLLLVKEYQRLKEQEQAQIGWTAKRELSKINYRIHTDAIKQNLIPTEVTIDKVSQLLCLYKIRALIKAEGDCASGRLCKRLLWKHALMQFFTYYPEKAVKSPFSDGAFNIFVEESDHLSEDISETAVILIPRQKQRLLQ